MTYRIHEQSRWESHRPQQSSNLRYTSHTEHLSSSPASKYKETTSRFPSLSPNHDIVSDGYQYARTHAHANLQAHSHNHNHNHIRSAPSSLPLRSSSLHSQHTITATTLTMSNNHPLPALPTPSTPSSAHSLARTKRKSNRQVAIHTSPITYLTTSQFQHNVFPILQVIASQMYRARVWKEANRWDGEGDVLSVKAPTMGQVLRRAENIGWNLGWEGWRW